MLHENSVPLGEPVAEPLQVLEGLLLDELGGDVLTLRVPGTGEHDQGLGLFLVSDGEHRQATLGQLRTEADNDRSEDLDALGEAVRVDHALPSGASTSSNPSRFASCGRSAARIPWSAR